MFAITFLQPNGDIMNKKAKNSKGIYTAIQFLTAPSRFGRSSKLYVGFFGCDEKGICNLIVQVRECQSSSQDTPSLAFVEAKSLFIACLAFDDCE